MGLRNGFEKWVDDAKKAMENALRANPLDVKEQYEHQIKDLQEAYGESTMFYFKNSGLTADLKISERIKQKPRNHAMHRKHPPRAVLTI